MFSDILAQMPPKYQSTMLLYDCFSTKNNISAKLVAISLGKREKAFSSELLRRIAQFYFYLIFMFNIDGLNSNDYNDVRP